MLLLFICRKWGVKKDRQRILTINQTSTIETTKLEADRYVQSYTCTILAGNDEVGTPLPLRQIRGRTDDGQEI